MTVTTVTTVTNSTIDVETARAVHAATAFISKVPGSAGASLSSAADLKALTTVIIGRNFLVNPTNQAFIVTVTIPKNDRPLRRRDSCCDGSRQRCSPEKRPKNDGCDGVTVIPADHPAQLEAAKRQSHTRRPIRAARSNVSPPDGVTIQGVSPCLGPTGKTPTA
jgi:hypothetical protein